MTDTDDRQRSVALYIAKSIPLKDTSAVRAWLNKLMEISAANLPAHKKATAAIAATIESKVAIRMAKVIALQSKALGWDNRTIAQRVGIGAAAISLATFGPAGAGVAALGGAIGLPLWVVLGGGAMFANLILQDMQSASAINDEVEAEVAEYDGMVIDVTPVKVGDALRPLPVTPKP